MIIKSISKMQKKEEPKAKEDSKEVKILEEIRDALKKSKK
jgi:large-conductance mechanosensitive channel